jgi:hypothetical protein
MKIAILIQSNDLYEHIWEGLFLSWKLNWNWNEFNFPVYVITETKDFTVNYKQNNFNTIKVGEDIKSINNYSNKLIRALDNLKNLGFTHVLYSQDDSWPLSTVDSLLLNDIINFIKRKEIKSFYLHEHFNYFPFTLKNTNISLQNKRVRQFARGSRFMYNHGNAFWDIDFLKNIQNINENAYVNECETTRRISNSNERPYIINISWYDQSLIHNKGELLETAKKIIKQLRFRYKWENLDDFSTGLVSYYSRVMDINTEDENYKYISEEELKKAYKKDSGIHFSDVGDQYHDKINYY